MWQATRIVLLLATFTTSLGAWERLSDRRFVIIIASYNNQRWCLWNLRSVLRQTYPHYRILYVNDCSTDRTAKMVQDLITREDREHRITLINNSSRKGALENHYEMIHNHCDDQEIAVVVDGDDALAGPHVLSFLNDLYCTKDIWLTYGQFRHLQGTDIGFCRQAPHDIVAQNSFRSWNLMPSHLRTYYVWLFKGIEKKDLVDEAGSFFNMTGDLATMMPMIEMARDHFWFNEKVLYIYNNTNPISDHYRSRTLQETIDQRIRRLPPYMPLTAPLVALQ